MLHRLRTPALPALRLAVAGLLLLPVLSAAQVARDTTADTTRAPVTVDAVVVTGARVPAVVGGAGTLMIRSDSLPLPAGPVPSVEQVLRQTPFVLVRQNSRGEVELSVRGSDSRQAAVLLEGLPLTVGWDHRADPSLLPAIGLGGIAFTRGLATLLEGPNTLGGVLSLDAPTSGAPGTGPTRGVIGLTLDQHAGRTIAGTLRHTRATRGGILSVAAGASSAARAGVPLDAARGAGGSDAGPSTADPGDADDPLLRTNSDLRQVSAFANARLQGPRGAHALLLASGYDAVRGVPPELHVASPRLWRYPVARRRLVVGAAGSGTHRWALGASSAALSVGTNDGRIEIDRFADRTFTAVSGREHGDEAVMSGRLVGTHVFRSPATVRLAATIADVRYREMLDVGTPDADTSRYRQRLASVGAELESLVAGRMLVSGGIVHDAASTPETGGRPPLGSLSSWGWRGGMSLGVGSAVRLHGSVSRRARFPALRELYSGALGRFAPNPELQPERLLASELGMTLERPGAGDALSLQAVAFHHRLADAIVRVTLPDGRFRRVNRDEVRSTGLELLGSWQSLRPARPGVTADAVVQRVRLPDPAAADARRPEHQPELRGSIAAALGLPHALRGSVIARYTGRQYCEHPDLGRQVALEGQGSVDAAVTRSWPIARAATALFRTLRASLTVSNLANATVHDQCGMPQPGRTIRLVMELT